MNEKKIYIVRKSWLDEETEYARCSEYDLAVSVCRPGYSVFDEMGIHLYTSVSPQIAAKHGKEWAAFKNIIEKKISVFQKRMFPFIRKCEFIEIHDTLCQILTLMNKVEIEESVNDLDKEVRKVINNE